MKKHLLTTVFLTLLVAHPAALTAQTPEIQQKVEAALELERLQGVWVPESVVRKSGIEKYPLKNHSLIFKGTTFQRKDGDKTFMEGRFVIDPSTEPKRMDMTLTDRNPPAANANTVLAVYKREGDTLTICYDVGSKGRPEDLKPGENRSVIVYKRKNP